MDRLAERLFPRLPGAWAEVNLDAELAGPARLDPNPCLDPDRCAWLVWHVANKHDAAHTYGGYLEDRARLWRGHYHQPGHVVHLGVDYNVPAGTPVCAPASGCQVIESRHDPDQRGGWGGRVVLQNDRGFLVLAHLDPAHLPAVGARCAWGTPLAVVGDAAVNGGWYPHLHAQFVTRAADLGADGYRAYGPDLAERFPHPAEWLGADPRAWAAAHGCLAAAELADRLWRELGPPGTLAAWEVTGCRESDEPAEWVVVEAGLPAGTDGLALYGRVVDAWIDQTTPAERGSVTLAWGRLAPAPS